jgi:hypothetical protein
MITKIAAVPNMIDLTSDVSSERSFRMNSNPKTHRRENKLPPSLSSMSKPKAEKGSVQAPLSKYPGRKTPLTKRTST